MIWIHNSIAEINVFNPINDNKAEFLISKNGIFPVHTYGQLTLGPTCLYKTQLWQFKTAKLIIYYEECQILLSSKEL